MDNPLIAGRWSEAAAAGLRDLDLLVYQSRLVGADPRLVVWGGGNTSLKGVEPDFRGRPVAVLRVKGSGSDLKAVTGRDFPGVRLDDVLPLFDRAAMSDEEMVAYLAHTLMEPQSARPSIETLLHAFVPARSVVHTHADAILALTNNERAAAILAEVFGDEVALIPYQRPGFALSKEVGAAVRARPDLQGVVLLNHGLITWHDDPRLAYARHIALVDRAARYAASAPRPVARPAPALPASSAPDAAARQAIAARLAPALRGLLAHPQPAGPQRVVVHFDDGDDVRAFLDGTTLPRERLRAAVAAGAATPDHILNTKRAPLLVEPPDLADSAGLLAATRDALAAYQRDYAAYFAAHQAGEPLLPPVPRVVLVAGLGMFAVGKDRRAAGIAADIYHHTMVIVAAAEQIGRYRSLSLSHAFAAEYWPLELYKLTLAPPEGELSRRVAVITGAAGAIGAGIAHALAAAAAHVVCADLDLERAQVLAADLTRLYPHTGALAVRMDVTDEASVQAAYQAALLEYGGLDVLVSNAGIAHSAPLDTLSLADWERSLAVNATGHFLVARAALRIFKAQGTGGSVVFIATKNVPAPGKDFGAYSAAKAAEAQLARVLALEGGPFGIRANLINPDAVFAGSGLWSPTVREERARAHGIDPADLEAFYRRRNLLGVDVSAADVGAAALFFAGDRTAKTTGAMLPVDGGLREAFPR